MKRRFHATFDSFRIDSDTGVFAKGVGVLPFQPKELAALCLLVANAGEVVSKEALIEQVWNGKPASDESIARCLSAVKSKLRAAVPDTGRLIKTEYGRGYRFIGKVSHRETCLSEESFYTLFNASPDFITIKDARGRWQFVNRAGIDFYGLQHVSWQDKTNEELAERVQPHFRESMLACAAADQSTWAAGEPCKFTENVTLHNGAERVFEVLKSPLYDEHGQRRTLVTLGRDITDKMRTLAQADLFAKVLANSNEAVVITDSENRIVMVNQAFIDITGYSEDEILGNNPSLLSSGRHPPEFYRALWQQLNTEGIWRGEIWDRRKNGEIYPKWLDISTVRDGNGNISHYIGIFSDISERKAIEEQVQFLAYHDPLTRLPNRLLLRDRFERAIRTINRGDSQSTIALMFLDLDQFKRINDTLGHVMGDQLLLGVSERLKKCVRSTDTISRLGGDEFVILLPDLTDLGIISVIAQKILDRLDEPFNIDGYMVSTSFSIGISIYPDDGADFDTLMKVADTAMYYAKDSGRNAYRFYTDQMNITALERLHIQNGLHRALKKNEFVLYYQPQLDLTHHRVIGMEALIRWQHPEEGLIMPGRFIPVAEESGLIVPIGEWVLGEACRQIRAWQDAGYQPIVIAVNISAIQFRRGDIVDTLQRMIREYGIDPAWLELELTESILIQHADRMVDMMERLKAIGIKLSIDDFGTGYSSLAYLKRFKVDRLKIDQSFIRNLGVDHDDAAIVRSIIQLARGLDLRTLAEGVESDAQLAILGNFGCDEVQGYFHSHPLPVDRATRYLNRCLPTDIHR